MKKVYYLLTIGFALATFQLFANSNETQKTQTAQAPNTNIQKNYDKELTVNLCDNKGTIIQCTQPETNGNFYFESLNPGEYSIIVVNNNGIKSEAYTVTCNSSEIFNNLNEVINPNNLVCKKSRLENHSCETKSPLKLSLSTTPLCDRGDLQFDLKNKSEVKVLVIDQNQSIVYTLPLGQVEAGVHTVNFDISELTGEYSISAQAGEDISTCQISVR